MSFIKQNIANAANPVSLTQIPQNNKIRPQQQQNQRKSAQSGSKQPSQPKQIQQNQNQNNYGLQNVKVGSRQQQQNGQKNPTYQHMFLSPNSDIQNNFRMNATKRHDARDRLRETLTGANQTCKSALSLRSLRDERFERKINNQNCDSNNAGVYHSQDYICQNGMIIQENQVDKTIARYGNMLSKTPTNMFASQSFNLKNRVNNYDSAVIGQVEFKKTKEQGQVHDQIGRDVVDPDLSVEDLCTSPGVQDNRRVSYNQQIQRPSSSNKQVQQKSLFNVRNMITQKIDMSVRNQAPSISAYLTKSVSRDIQGIDENKDTLKLRQRSSQQSRLGITEDLQQKMQNIQKLEEHWKVEKERSLSRQSQNGRRESSNSSRILKIQQQLQSQKQLNINKSQTHKSVTNLKGQVEQNNTTSMFQFINQQRQRRSPQISPKNKDRLIQILQNNDDKQSSDLYKNKKDNSVESSMRKQLLYHRNNSPETLKTKYESKRFQSKSKQDMNQSDNEIAPSQEEYGQNKKAIFAYHSEIKRQQFRKRLVQAILQH
eukprot:403334631